MPKLRLHKGRHCFGMQPRKFSWYGREKVMAEWKVEINAYLIRYMSFHQMRQSYEHDESGFLVSTCKFFLAVDGENMIIVIPHSGLNSPGRKVIQFQKTTVVKNRGLNYRNKFSLLYCPSESRDIFEQVLCRLNRGYVFGK